MAWQEKDGIESIYLDVETQYKEIKERIDHTKVFVAHNWKFDCQKLRLSGLIKDSDRPEFHDTEALAHLLNEHRPKKLKYLAREILGIDTKEEKELAAIMRKLKIKKADGYHKIPKETLIPYAVKDAEYTLQLFHVLFAQLLQKEKSLQKLYEMEKELTWILLDMETKGMKIDQEYVRRAKGQYANSVLHSELKSRDISNKEGFNPRSNKQVREYFEGKGIQREKYDKQNLLEIADPMAEILVSLRKNEKILKTYLGPMESESSIDGLLHPNFRQYQTVTGRMASGKVER